MLFQRVIVSETEGAIGRGESSVVIEIGKIPTCITFSQSRWSIMQVSNKARTESTQNKDDSIASSYHRHLMRPSVHFW